MLVEWDFEVGDYYVQINAGVHTKKQKCKLCGVRVPVQVVGRSFEWITQLKTSWCKTLLADAFITHVRRKSRCDG